MSEAPHAGSFSIGRVLLLVVPLALVAWAAKMYSGNLETDAQANLERTMVTRLLGDTSSAATLDKKFTDADGDLVADAPKDAAQALDPKEINFSYVASSDTEDEAETWKELLAALESRLGRKVNLVEYNDADEQLRALEAGDLHVTAFATGEVQGAVNEAGFVPAACFADKDDKFHYSMKIIVPADSKIEKVEDLKDQRMTFVRPRSNSGCTAALVMLMKEHDLQPERDYTWGWSFGHENSINGIAEKKFSAAAVASDILDRMIAGGDVQEAAIRVIYESEPYPPGVIGYAYNLTPELQEGIRETLLGFAWEGTGLEKTYGASAEKFAPVDYKKDWEPVRAINKTGSELFAKLDAPAI
ncbi:MAG: phosphate/phosphite/phosphonate ABC transporter substrate-binding protein [Pirellulales bacterium]|nr:phosphate/phosphite/phosphonate ABC transporter substrate-binding protein [Pirellulales bacterium]